MTEQVIEKIKKILALAERGGTEEEAANAANMAAALALRYGIDLASVQTANMAQPRGFKSAVLYQDNGSFEQWLINIAGGVVSYHGGNIFYKAAQGMTLYCAIMRDELAPVATLTIEYLVKSVMRLNTEAVKGRNLDQKGRASFRKAFRLGCSGRLRQRLLEQLEAMKSRDDVAKQTTGSTALVIVNHFEREKRELQDWMIEQGVKFRASKASGPRSLDSAGYNAGRAAGDRINLNAQVGADKTSGRIGR